MPQVLRGLRNPEKRGAKLQWYLCEKCPAVLMLYGVTRDTDIEARVRHGWTASGRVARCPACKDTRHGLLNTSRRVVDGVEVKDCGRCTPLTGDPVPVDCFYTDYRNGRKAAIRWICKNCEYALRKERTPPADMKTVDGVELERCKECRQWYEENDIDIRQVCKFCARTDSVKRDARAKNQT